MIKFNGKEIKAKMSVQYGLNWAQVKYEISAPGQKPIVKEIISPYNKKMILEV